MRHWTHWYGLFVGLTLVTACEPPPAAPTKDSSHDPAQRQPHSAPEATPTTSSARIGITRQPGQITLDLVTMHEHGRLNGLPTTTVRTTDDPAYGGSQRFVGWPLKSLLTHLTDLPVAPEQFVIQFIALDGYKATVSLDKLPIKNGVVAFRHVGAPSNEDWASFQKGDTPMTPAPFYLIWTSSNSGPHRPWAYKLAEIRIARARHLWGAAVPTDQPLKPGFEVFRQHCIKCHSVNLAGGSVGPELNVPMNITEYWKSDHLRQFIKHPKSYRADAKMPRMADNLTPDQLDHLIRYLQGMADHKICTSPAGCPTR